MCGIAGIVFNNSEAEKQTAIRRMTDAIAHRGPDADGHFADRHVALGHRRLSIIDLSPEANQPFWDTTGRYAMVFNGEVYNYMEVRKRLADYPFRTKSDTEVVLAAYIRWGADCLQYFYGMFAFAVWDMQERRLFLVRDRLGIKPLYYFHEGQKLVFGSEIRALLASSLVDKKLNRKGLYNYLTYQTVHAPNTMVEGVQQLNPGEFAIFENGNLTKKSYWQLSNNSKQLAVGSQQAIAEGFDNYDTVKKNVRRLLYEAVERRLVSDVPLGAFLSGGIDSTAVVALMSEAAGRAVDTFSVVFEEEKYDESKWSSLVARQYNTNHHSILLKPTDFLDALPDALRAMDAPSGDGVNTYVVSKVTKQAGVTVALSGLGGDELFAGYSFFQQYVRLHGMAAFWKIPSGLRAGGASIAKYFLKSHQQARVAEIAGARSGAIEEVYPAFRKVLALSELGAAAANGNGYPDSYREHDAVRQLLSARKDLKNLPLLSQVSVADISTYTQNVLLRDTDQMSMAHALEVRVPFFDHALVEYVLRIPDQWKYPTFAKKLLVESLHPLIPDEVVFRQKKGFELPWKVWLKNELRSFCEEKLVRFAERDLVERRLPARFLAGIFFGKK